MNNRINTKGMLAIHKEKQQHWINCIEIDREMYYKCLSVAMGLATIIKSSGRLKPKYISDMAIELLKVVWDKEESDHKMIIDKMDTKKAQEYMNMHSFTCGQRFRILDLVCKSIFERASKRKTPELKIEINSIKKEVDYYFYVVNNNLIPKQETKNPLAQA